MRFKDDNDNRYRVNFTRATEAHIDKMTVAEFIEYLENNAEFEDESTPIYIDGKTIWCKDCVLKETYKLRKEFLVSEDGSRLFYAISVTKRAELVKDLQEERAAIIQQQEQRTSLLAAIAAGEVTDVNGNPTAPTVLRNIAPADGSGAEQRTAVNKYETMEYRKAFMEYVTRGVTIPKEYRQDAVSQTTDVGAVIPTNVLNQIITKLESVGNILAKVTRTAYKGGVTIPKSTVKPVATWTAQGKGSDKQKQDTSGTVNNLKNAAKRNRNRERNYMLRGRQHNPERIRNSRR